MLLRQDFQHCYRAVDIVVPIELMDSLIYTAIATPHVFTSKA